MYLWLEPVIAHRAGTCAVTCSYGVRVSLARVLPTSMPTYCVRGEERG